MTDDRTDRVVGRLRPEVDASSQLDPAAPAARELRSMITAQAQEIPMPVKPRTRRLLIATPIAAALAAGGIVATALFASPDGPDGAGSPLGPEPAAAAVLDISVDEGVVVAEVLDPTADAERYAAEFAEHGLDVRMRFVPASPSVVGNLVYLDSNMTGDGTDERDVEVVESPGQCTPQPGFCPAGVRIPEDYGNTVEVVFGREAEPGETYDSTNDATAAGETLEGVDIEGMTVGDLRSTLEGLDQEIAEYRQNEPGGLPAEEAELLAESAEQEEGDGPSGDAPSPENGEVPPPADPGSGGGETLTPGEDEVGDDWLVEDVSLWAPGQVLVFVSEP